MTLGNLLKNARSAKNMTQKEVAEAVGIELNSYQNYEYEVRQPRADILLKLIRILDLDIDEVEKILENKGSVKNSVANQQNF
jgi:transcriptional regulator with XRE-family HTH domain